MTIEESGPCFDGKCFPHTHNLFNSRPTCSIYYLKAKFSYYVEKLMERFRVLLAKKNNLNISVFDDGIEKGFFLTCFAINCHKDSVAMVTLGAHDATICYG